MAALLAIVSSFAYALTMVIARVGLRKSDSFSGSLVSVCFSLAGALVAFAVFMPIHSISIRSIVFFAAAGISGPCVGRLLLYAGINRVGSAVASSVYSVKPLFAALAAVLLLGEKITAPIGIGTLMIVVGLVIISSTKGNGQTTTSLSKKDLIFPLLAGASYGLAQVLRKLGLLVNAEPVLGLLIQNFAAISFTLAIANLQKGQKKVRAWSSLRGWAIFGSAGICSAIGQLCVFAALNIGDVVIVVPLTTISPLFVLLMAALFLRDIERITWKIGLGTCCILAAAILLALS